MNNAKLFAIAAHSATGQKRKYTDEPYWHHPQNVARWVATTDQALKMPEIIAAAWLHDVVEDTEISIAEIDSLFGPKVAQLVAEVTDISKKEDGNRVARKAIDRVHLSMASAEGQTIKLADLIDNSESIVERDPEFAKVYMKEKTALLKVLIAGDQFLYKTASAIVQDYYKKQDNG
jgi:(p)ppGpp synthase/HD superfamily hydrolase